MPQIKININGGAKEAAYIEKLGIPGKKYDIPKLRTKAKAIPKIVT